jgi:AcrR family transcriptional regulator
MMSETNLDTIDPRIRRTRQLLQQALGKLLETRDFEKISVQDIAEQATLNRATFYDHYPDKFALLECMVAGQFHELLERRRVKFDGTCAAALQAIVLGVCDYLASTPQVECERHRQMEPHFESAVISVVRAMILGGLKQHAADGAIAPEMVATTASWAIYGAAKEWVRTPNRGSSEEIVGVVMTLVAPILAATDAQASASR